ncbi:MAG: 16S rRNA (adenine(1518)-N(6)/adenine(1519)-N(6))-dimethyltransferase RsmA [Nitritalea sp.]
MAQVRPKKHLGQHFLTDLSIAKRIAEAVQGHEATRQVLEIGPGMGVLTQFLLDGGWDLSVVEVDRESVEYLQRHFAQLEGRILFGDYLKLAPAALPQGTYVVAGNFPYNISSQIFFRVLELRSQVTEVVCMLQKEVAERIAAPKGSKTYGILSVLLQAFYEVEYLFTVPPDVFNPPPKVQSGVIRLRRLPTYTLPCSEKKFFTVVKQSFSTRRKTLRNCLKSIGLSAALLSDPVMDLRAEQLSVQDFIQLTQKIEADGTA